MRALVPLPDRKISGESSPEEPAPHNSSAVLALLPARPGLYFRIGDLARDPNSTLETIAREILTDGAATIAVLRLANSAAYYRRRQIPSVTEAVTVIGLEGVRMLLLTIHLRSLYRPAFSGLYAELWTNALTAAMIARAIAGMQPPRDQTLPERAYIAGLVHDVGHLALLQEFGPAALSKGIGSAAVPEERRRFGRAHTELGAAIARDWQLPASICDAVLLHHEPVAEATDLELASIVHLASLLSRESGGHGEPEHPSSLALHTLGWTPEDFAVQRQLLPRYRAMAGEMQRTTTHHEPPGLAAIPSLPAPARPGRPG